MTARTRGRPASGDVRSADQSQRVIVDAVVAWYADNARDLPWRRPGTSAYAILVSEVMAQQTPVERVIPSWHRWLELWPTPAALAEASPAEVLRIWDRLGYPRRALRLREAAIACVESHGGEIPTTYDELVVLPGVGDYTAGAVLAFAYGQPAVVLDTNVRRVLARALDGVERPRPSVTVAERQRSRDLLPEDAATAATWAQAVMELGALVCTASRPSCDACPIAAQCAWVAAGAPTGPVPAPRAQGYAGTDRQVRGLIMALLRSCDMATQEQVDALWPDTTQRDRALDSLLSDGLVERLNGRVATYRLPH